MNKPEFWNYTIGMILGDGFLTRPNRLGRVGQNSTLRVNHSIKQWDYLLYKADILKHLTKVNIGKSQYFHKIQNKTYQTCYLETRVHPWYTKLRERCYRNGIKEINSFMMKHLGDEGIAIWACDDGNIENNQLQIATNSFSEAENYLAKKVLAGRGYYCSVGKRHKYYYLRFSADSTEKIMGNAKRMAIPINKVSSYDRPPLSPMRRSDGTFKKGFKWSDDIV